MQMARCASRMVSRVAGDTPESASAAALALSPACSSSITARRSSAERPPCLPIGRTQAPLRQAPVMLRRPAARPDERCRSWPELPAVALRSSPQLKTTPSRDPRQSRRRRQEGLECPCQLRQAARRRRSTGCPTTALEGAARRPDEKADGRTPTGPAPRCSRQPGPRPGGIVDMGGVADDARRPHRPQLGHQRRVAHIDQHHVGFHAHQGPHQHHPWHRRRDARPVHRGLWRRPPPTRGRFPPRHGLHPPTHLRRPGPAILSLARPCRSEAPSVAG